ncbi:MAG TPA: CHAD domain-containing protein [Polyangia bacterium]|nr:CHAD domain-containing protein [Polyangia bacterium]
MARPSPIDGLDADTPLAEAARRALAVRLLDVRTLAERVARARDADGVHDLRVATRRLRAAIGLFDRSKPRKLSDARAEVKRLGDALGRVRDLDVQLEWLDAELANERPSAERAGIAALAGDRRRELGPHEHALAAELEHFRAEVAPRLEEELALVDGAGRFGGRPLRNRLRERLARIETAALEAIESPDPRTAHKLRIAVKKLRYDAELLEPAHPDEIGPILRALVPLQETLGDLHDRDVRLDLLVRFVARCKADERAGAIALIAEDLRERDRLAAELQAELRSWEAERLARALRRSLK